MYWYLSLIVCPLLMEHYSEATCNIDQQYSCKRAVREERLDVLPGGGECFEKEYVQFAYLCVVSNYLPSVDYCCCALVSAIFCCRYHQDWNQFRCLHEEDQVTSRSLNETDSEQEGTDHLAHFLRLSLPTAVLLLILLLLGLGIVGYCLVAAGISCCSKRYRNCIIRIRDKKRNGAPKKSLRKTKEPRFRQRTPIRDLDSLSGLMHGPIGVSSPDHLPHASVTYEDYPIVDNRTDGDSLNRPSGHRIILQPSAPSLAEILTDDCGLGFGQSLACPSSMSVAATEARSSVCESGVLWPNSFQRPRLEWGRQDCIAPSAAESPGHRRIRCLSGPTIPHQVIIGSCPPPRGVEESQQPHCALLKVVSANIRH